MHIQELETIQRHKLNILAIILNDGAYGSEVHKLRLDNSPLNGSVFGRPSFKEIASGFGFKAKQFKQLKEMQTAFEKCIKSSKPEIWDVHISDKIASPQILKTNRKSST